MDLEFSRFLKNSLLCVLEREEMPFFESGTHTIEVKLGSDGEVTVLYDGLMISHKEPYTFSGPHRFSIKEGDAEIIYEVKVKPKGGRLGAVTGIGKALAPVVEVFRNGEKLKQKT